MIVPLAELFATVCINHSRTRCYATEKQIRRTADARYTFFRAPDKSAQTGARASYNAKAGNSDTENLLTDSGGKISVDPDFSSPASDQMFFCR
jgi:hypothetical protein